MKEYASRMSRLGTETAFEVLAKAKALEAQGKEILHFEIGEPDFDTPQHIKEAAWKALQAGQTHYCPSPGIDGLRQAIAKETSESRGISVKPSQVVVTPGAKPIMFFTLLTCVEEGDEVIYPNPGFPIYESMINFAGGKPVPAPLLEEKGFSFDMERFEKSVTDKTKLIILNSPQNPTGGIIPYEDLKTIAEIAVRHQIYVLADEIYRGMQYEGEFTSIASFPSMQDLTIILDGFSKRYAMTGWRLGYGVMHEHLAQHFTKLMVNSNSCTPPFIQFAGIEALTGDQEPSVAMARAFRRRRDLIVQGLNEVAGFTCTLPAGAFYAFPNIKAHGKKSAEMARDLLEEGGIASLSGTAFGQYGEGYLRFSYANSEENIKKLIVRLKEMFN